MITTLVSFSALLFGFGLIMVGAGLQGTLLALRASMEAFPVAVTGLIMAGYYLGYLVGSRMVPPLVKRVGHIRVFAAFSALASTCILLHAAWVNPAIWFFIRVLTGVCFCGIFVVVESWLNHNSPNEKRGQALAVYMIVQAVAYALGQLLLHVAAPTEYELFIIVSVLISVATIPILLTASPAPAYQTPQPIDFPALYRTAPLGVVGVFLAGMAMSGYWTLGPVFGQSVGLSVEGVGHFMGVVVMGGALFQWPLGRLSDRGDRRRLLAWVALGSAAVSALGIPVAGQSEGGLLVLGFVFGGLTIPVYSLLVAHTNDRISQDQRVAASTTLLFFYGVGAVIGPIITAGWMEFLGARGFFVHMALFQGAIGGYAWHRIRKVAPVPEAAAMPYVLMPPRLSEVAAALAPGAAQEHREKQTDGSPAAGQPAPASPAPSVPE